MNVSWQAEVYALMRDHGISRRDLAITLGVTPEWVSMVLNKHRNATGAEAKFRAAIQTLVESVESKE